MYLPIFFCKLYRFFFQKSSGHYGMANCLCSVSAVGVEPGLPEELTLYTLFLYAVIETRVTISLIDRTHDDRFNHPYG